MAERITDETMEYVEILAKLELTEEERAQAKADMSRMLDYIDQLNELDTSGTGFLYFITVARTGEGTGPVDASVYEAWRDQYLDMDGVLPLTWHALSEENIQALERGTLPASS